MKEKQKVLLKIFILVAITAIFIFINRQKIIPRFSQVSPPYHFGQIRLDPQKRLIEFAASVKKNNGKVKFLIYLDGYQWLKDDCAIVSDAKLADLQKAIAAIDWKLWDELWLGSKLMLSRQITVEIDQQPADSFLEKPSPKLGLPQLIFLGSPYFDRLVLNEGEDANCQSCNFRQSEEDLVKEMLGSNLGYQINPRRFPAPGAKVKVTLKL
jgi:hypothetical protein